MALMQVKNNAESTLAGGITAGATTLTVASGEGAKFPAGNFRISIDDEILHCTSRSSDTFTVQRGQEGTTAAAHDAGAEVQLRWTAGYVEERDGALSHLTDLHTGPFTLVVQTQAQTITANQWTKMQFHQVRCDTYSAWDSNNHRFIVPVTGYYLIVGRASLQNLPDTRRIAVSVMVNGTEEPDGGRIYDSVVGGTNNIVGSGALFNYLEEDDYVELFVWHNDTQDRQTVGAPRTDALGVLRIA